MRTVSSFVIVFIFLFSSFSYAAVQVVKTITVNLNGHGNFNNIQAAIDSVPNGNDKWIRIYIRGGVYKEKVNIPVEKGFLLLEGDGALQTSIEWNDFAPASLDDYFHVGDDSESRDVAASATFTVSAANVIVKGITLKNTYGNSKTQARAIAALISGDKTSFYNCSFIGIQDTLCDLLGRHYFKDCYVEGAVDFIFGVAQSLYEDCTLSTVPSMALAGWITAHGRANANDPTGFVFKNCQLTGSANTYLGRAWGPNSRVIFYQTNMPNIVVPDGWDYWQDSSKGAYTTYVESSCTGSGSNTTGRVKWEKTLSNTELSKLTSKSFVDDGWLGQQAW